MKENMINRVPLRAFRQIRWMYRTWNTYRFNRAHFSKKYAEACLLVDNAYHWGHSIEKKLEANSRKDGLIMDYLQMLCKDVIEQYQNGYRPPEKAQGEKKIWVFWWTGEDSAPDIVRACINSIRRNAGTHEVIMLDQNNYRKYITLPPEIEQKHDSGHIGHAHFSDMIRLSLLAEYGGVWIDATVFISQPIPEIVFEKNFYTMKSYDPQSSFFSKSRWVGYFLAGDNSFELFPFVRDCLFAHWKQTDTAIDYLLMDYCFELACLSLDSVKKAIDELPDNNLKRGHLMAAINAPYNSALFEELSSGENFVSKLSWRYGNPTVKTEDGMLTNYGHLLEI